MYRTEDDYVLSFDGKIEDLDNKYKLISENDFQKK